MNARLNGQGYHGVGTGPDVDRPPRCPYCDAVAELVNAEVIYPGRNYSGRYWRCAPCRAWVGVHKNSARAAPLGTLADARLRARRMALHNLFDPLWKSGKMGRKDAYTWLAGVVGVPIPKCHVGYFNIDQCERALRALANLEEPTR